MTPMRPGMDARRTMAFDIQSRILYIFMLLTLLFLSGCSNLPASKIGTPFPDEFLPTFVAMTVQAESQPTAPPSSAVPSLTPHDEKPPEDLLSPTPGSTSSADTLTDPGPASTLEPTPTSTLTPTPDLPPAGVQIINPGPASKVVSPLDVYVNLRPGSRGNVTFELLGEDGRLLVRKIISANPDRRLNVTVELEFEIPVVAEAGRLVVSSEDENGRVVVLSSVELLLLTIGQDDLTPGGARPETIIIREPTASTLIQGGTMIISGIAKPEGVDNLTIELIADDGRRLINPRLVTLTPVPGNSYSEYSIELPYNVEKTTWVLVVVSESSGRIPGITHLSSVRVLLSP